MLDVALCGGDCGINGVASAFAGGASPLLVGAANALALLGAAKVASSTDVASDTDLSDAAVGTGRASAEEPVVGLATRVCGGVAMCGVPILFCNGGAPLLCAELVDAVRGSGATSARESTEFRDAVPEAGGVRDDTPL